MRPRHLLSTLSAVLLAAIGSAHAVDIFVDSTADNLTAGDGLCTIREALQNANLAAGGDTTGGDCVAGAAGFDQIRIPAGTYLLTLAGANEDLNATGDLDIRDAVNFRGAGSATTIIDGQALDRVVDVQTSAQVEIRALRLDNGMTPDDGGGLRAILGGPLTLTDVEIRENQAAAGGAIDWQDGTLAMTNVKLLDNSTTTIGGGAVQAQASSTAVTLTMVGGEIQRNNSGRGGGIRAATIGGGTLALTLDGVLVADNTATFDGGGLDARGSINVSITDCTFRGNRASASKGGAVYHDAQDLVVNGGTFETNIAGRDGGGFWLNTTSALDATIDGAQILDNDTSGGGSDRGGGGIFLLDGDLLVTGTVIDGNFTTVRGGGLASDSPGSVEIHGSTVSGNSAPLGGGMYFLRGDLLVLRTTVSDNSAFSSSGGGISVSASSTVTVRRSTVVGNQADTGGGGISSSASLLQVLNSTVSGNTTAARGGGISGGGTGLVRLDFSTVTNNNAGTSGAGIVLVSASATVEAKNSVVSGNDPTASECDLPAGAMTSLGYNLDEDGSCGLGGGPGDIVAGSTTFGPLQDNGGPTWTHALLSPGDAIDAADPNCQAHDGTPISIDQRGAPRPRDGDGDLTAVCDIGAFEAPDAAFLPPPVPDGSFGVPMRASRGNPAGTEIDVTWDVTLCTSLDFHMIGGALASVASYNATTSQCNLGTTGSATLSVPAGNGWFLILADDGNQTEGSWGQATSGERNGTTHSGECGVLVRDNSGTCP